MSNPVTNLKGFSTIPPTAYANAEDRDTDYMLHVWAPFDFQPAWRDMEEWDRQRSREWFREHLANRIRSERIQQAIAEGDDQWMRENL